MNIHIICIGNLKENYWRQASAEYEKRLSRFGKIVITELSEVNADGAQNIQKEGEAILKKIDPSGYTIALCVEGKQKSSEELSKLFEKVSLDGKSKVTFVIGGSDGMCEQVKKAANLRLSFSAMTFPHQMMRVILLEQIYRAFKISAGESYHK